MRLRGRNNRLKLGDWNVIDDLTGFKEKASNMVRRWDGMLVRRRSVEQRHPQDFLRAVPETVAVPFVRPVPALQFIEPYPASVPFDPRTLDPNFVPSVVVGSFQYDDGTTITYDDGTPVEAS